MPATSKIIMVAVLILGAGGVALDRYMSVRQAASEELGKDRFNRLGYLQPKELPDGVSLLAPPPSPGSPAMAHDEEVRAAALKLRGTPRYALAQADAVRTEDATVDAFQCAFGTAITNERTPRLYELLSRVRLDARALSYPAKAHFRRQRPFVAHHVQSCYPADEAMIREDGSYPSARGSVGWAFALVLAKLNSRRATEVLQRGHEFGQSRVVCDQEWESDVVAGGKLATALVKRLQSNAHFRSDLAAASKEVAAELSAGISPTKDCRPEIIALASR